MSTNPNLGKYVPLKMVVALALDEMQKSDGDQDQAWLYGMRSLVKLNQQITAEPKTVRLPVQPNKTVPFPVDCLSWSKIGLLNSNNEITTLRINPGLTTWRDNNPNRIQDLIPNVNDSIGALGTTPFYFNYYYDGGYYNLFGVAGGLIQYGECRVDDANRVVVLPTTFKYDNIMFEYISAPERDEDYQVLLAFQEAIIAFIKWKFKMGTREEFYAEALEARRTLPGKKVTLQGIAQWVRDTQGQYLKS